MLLFINLFYIEMFKILFSVFSILFVGYVSGNCSWPDVFANTVWHDSSKGEITFTADRLSGWTITITGVENSPQFNTWRCHSTALYESDQILVMITENTFSPFETQLYGYICLKLTEITPSSYRYYLYYRQETSIDNERVAMRMSDSEENWGTLCFLDDQYAQYRPADSEYRVMLKSSSLTSTKIDCPFVFLGSYDYSHTSSDGTVTCDSSANIMSTCTDSEEISFDYTTCSTKVAYSVSDKVWCVDTVPSGGNNYVTVYNGYDTDTVIDNVDVFQFACFAISEDGTTASVVPNSCRKDQTSDAFPTNNGDNIGSLLALSKSTESCLTCPLVTAPDSGSVSYSTVGAVTTASYSCSSEYSLAGAETRICQNNQSWTDEDPTCTCIAPSAPANGSMVISVDGTLTYSCDVGFVLNGDRTRECLTNSNTWSGVEPTCDPCEEITFTKGLNITASTTGTTTVSYFTCLAGYTLDGSSNSTCLSSGVWGSEAPTCSLCDNITSTATMQADVDTDGFTSMASFTCVAGYHIVGQSTATCDITGTWSSIPACECDEQVIPADGSKVGNGTNAQFSCDVGYNLIGSSSVECLDDGTGWNADPPSCDGCDSPVSPDGGYYNLSTDGSVTMATYSCNIGYTISGQRISHCQNDGSWNGTVPLCIKCPDLTDPSSGTVTLSTDGSTSMAEYACATGYDISMETTSTCLTDGSWTNSPPTCSCSPASVPMNGAVLSDNGEAVYYQCNLNYSMNGTSVRDCAADGSGWSDSDPICVECVSLGSVTGGSLVASTDGVNTKIEYSCDTGYTINGKREITCNSDGSWDSAQSSCTQCNALTAPTGGNFTMHSVDDTVTKATFTCDVGYVLDGYSELTCLNTGTWDIDIPECVECKARDNPTSGNLTLQTDGQTTTGTYSCADGYEIVGQEIITCRIDGNWNYPSAECKCVTPSAPSDGGVTADGEIVTFTCNTGFTMSGDSTGTCNTDGTGWSIAFPQCVQCESLVNFTSGNVTYSTDGSTTVVEYSCPEGSSLQGSSVVSCSESGSWEAELPECVSCPTLPSVSVTTGSVTLVTNGTITTAEYSCPQGYQVKGEETLTCNSDGTWNNDPSDCVCETPSIPEGGDFTVADDGLSVNFTCGEGYTILGEQTITCGTDGSGWTLEYPSCTKCENLTIPTNGNITLVTSGTQTTAVYSCGVGYSLDGATEPTCQSDGTWTTVEQTCVSCPEIPSVSITGGTVSLETNGTTTTAVYSCPDGYEVNGQETLTCNSSGTWDSSPSTCVCESPGIPDGGSYTMSEDGLSVMFACNEGYTIAGVQEITCATDGSGWTMTFPNCTKCDTVTAPVGGSLKLVTNGTQTLAIYTCDLNSSLSGVATQECNMDGTWQSTEPTCESCASLPSISIATGSLSIVTNGTTTTAEYICPLGYEVKGDKTLTCNPDGTWSNVPSDCVCETPSVPDGGNFTRSEDSLSVLFTCEEGYTMQGVGTITCGTDGSGWALAFPNCTKCEDLTTPANGNITLTTTGSETTAVYTCGVGFTLEGSAAPSCQSDGTWTSVEQTCVSCPELPNVTITGGTVSLNTNGTTTTAVYSCPDGYEVKGQETLTCNSSGTWDSSPSACVCAMPELPEGGSYRLSEDALSVIFACDIGYTMSGVQEVTCATDGSGWQLTFPNCTQCASVLNPDGGNVTLFTNGTQTLAVYTCGLGSSLDGEANPECLEDGTWQFSEPICVTCPELPDVTISSGNVTIVTDGATTAAVYNCPPGYEVKASQAITCTTDGTWSSGPSDCVCQTPNTTEGGNFTLSEDGLTVTFTCEAGYTMVGEQVISCSTDGSGWNLSQPNCTKCEDVLTPEGGEVVLLTSGAQTTAVYACDIGYTLDGQAAPECGTDGIWTADSPVCVNCPELANVTSASLNITTNGQTTKAVFTCDDGYEMDGNAIITCRTNGSWDSELPICFCTAPSEPLFGSVISNSTTAIYSCDEGYILKGTSVRTCQENGQGWSGSAPSCTTCDLLSEPDDGTYTLTTNGTVTIATFICGVGFSMNGTQTLVCLDDGSWSENAPACVQCPTLVQPNSGSLTMSTDNVLTSAVYSCSPGYYIVGENLLVCSSEGQWNASEPFCACNTLTAPDNGNVEISIENATATYTCDLGYSIDGVATRACATDGSGWSGLAPHCVGCSNVTIAIDGNFNLVTDGTVTSVNFQCDNGATIDGASTLTCQGDGTWTSVQPTCVVCPSLSEPSGGNVSMETDGQTSTVTYTCADNYELVGEATRECQTDGTWTGVNTSCVCAPPAAPENGTVTLADDNLVVSYKCDLSFSLVGDTARTCQADGSGWTGSDPACVSCEALAQPVHGTVTTSTNGTHTISTFTCSLGTSMQGQLTSICQQDATWSSPEPSCVTCPNVTDPSSGSVTTSTDGATTTAIYACANGYKIIGQNETTCQIDGSWSESTPECVCEDPESDSNGIVSSDGREAIFQCNTGYSLNGQSLLSCGANGSGWDYQAPNCVKCLNVSEPNSGNIVFTSTGINTFARFECDVGTSLNGSAVLRCDAEGKWNDTEPYCVVCESIDPPVNGMYTLSSDGATTAVQLQCNEGFLAAGTTKIECGPDGKWTFSQESTCDKVEKKANSLFGELIGVSVTSLVIITVLSLVLARFVYLYLQTKKKRGQYETDILPFENFKRSQMDDFPLAPVKLRPSAAPVNHQRHVLESGSPFSTSPAPQAFEDHVAGNGAVPFSPLPIETHRSGDSVISFRRSATTVNNKSLTSVSEITIANANQKMSSQAKSNGVPTTKDSKIGTLSTPDMKSNRLSPIPNHKQMVKKLNQSSPRIPKLILETDGSQSPPQVRSSTPTIMKHSINVSNQDTKSFDSVSVVDA